MHTLEFQINVYLKNIFPLSMYSLYTYLSEFHVIDYRIHNNWISARIYMYLPKHKLWLTISQGKYKLTPVCYGRLKCVIRIFHIYIYKKNVYIQITNLHFNLLNVSTNIIAV